MRIPRLNKEISIFDTEKGIGAGINEAATTATNYIYADSSGIKIANSSPSTATTYQLQTATSTEFVVSGTSLAEFGSTVRVGPEASGHTVTTASGMDVYSDATTSVASFGSTARIGRAAKNRVEIDNDSFIVYGKIGSSYEQLFKVYVVNGRANLQCDHANIDGISTDTLAATTIGGVTTLRSALSSSDDLTTFTLDGSSVVVNYSNQETVVTKNTVTLDVTTGNLTTTGYITAEPLDITDQCTWSETLAHGFVVYQAGMVHIAFQGNSTTHSSGTTLFTLPSGYWPADYVYAPFTKNGNAYGTLGVRSSNGQVYVNTISSTSASGRIYANFSFPVA